MKTEIRVTKVIDARDRNTDYVLGVPSPEEITELIDCEKCADGTIVRVWYGVSEGPYYWGTAILSEDGLTLTCN